MTRIRERLIVTSFRALIPSPLVDRDARCHFSSTVPTRALKLA
jgi:hypothetical protein